MWLLLILLILLVIPIKEHYMSWRGIEINEKEESDGFPQYKINDSKFWSRMFDYVMTGETREQWDPSKKPECRGFTETNDVNSMEAMIADPFGSGSGKINTAYCSYEQIKDFFKKKPAKKISFDANSLLSINNCPYQGYGGNWFSNLKKPGWYPPGFIDKNGDTTCMLSESFDFEAGSVDANYLCEGRAGSYNPASSTKTCK